MNEQGSRGAGTHDTGIRYQQILVTLKYGSIVATYIFTVLACIVSSFKTVISSAVHLLSYKNFHLLTCPVISHARASSILLSHITIKYAQS